MGRYTWFACLTLCLLTLLNNNAFAEHHEGAAAEPEASATETQAATAEQATANAGRYTCTLQGLTRRVEIAYATDGAGIPCDVNYYKDSEAPGAVSTLWSAQNLQGYCEQKAAEFVEKLQSWGWDCAPN